jgi:hypothetical protein
MNMREGCLVYILLMVIAFGFSYLVTAGLIWLIMWGLSAIGVVLPIAWSWGLSAVVWLILFLLRSTVRVNVNGS